MKLTEALMSSLYIFGLPLAMKLKITENNSLAVQGALANPNRLQRHPDCKIKN